MSSFVRYILKFKNDRNPYGDVARDILMDTEVNRAWGYRSFVRHLVKRNASQRVYEIVDDLHFQYKEMK
jgi:hypothetical protein